MKYKYVLLKSSWGVVIFLEVEEIRNPVLQEGDILVVNRIYLRLESIDKLPKEDVEIILTQGIKSLSGLIVNQLGDESVCYHVKSIDFNYTDFQIEGLYCAIREWIAKYYNIQITPVSVMFDAEKNRYIFDLPDMHDLI